MSKNNSSKLFVAFKYLSLLIVVPALMFGCSSSKKATTGNDAKPGSASKVQLPAGFSPDFPKPEGGKLVAAKWQMDEGGEVVHLATWEIKTSAADTIAAYKKSLPTKGWQVTSVTGTTEPDIAFTKSGDPGESHLKVVTVAGKKLLQVRIY